MYNFRHEQPPAFFFNVEAIFVRAVTCANCGVENTGFVGLPLFFLFPFQINFSIIFRAPAQAEQGISLSMAPSLIEALNSYCAPETLDERNQYHCEKSVLFGGVKSSNFSANTIFLGFHKN